MTDIDASPVAHCVLDDRGIVEGVNASALQLFGLPRAEVVGRSLGVVVEEGFLLHEHLARCVTSAGAQDDVILAVGRHVHARVITTPLKSEPRRFLSAILDVDDCAQEANQLRFVAEASERLAAFLDVERIIAETVRTLVPFTADLCYVDLLDENGRLQRIDITTKDRGESWLADRLRIHSMPLDADSPQLQVLESCRSRIFHGAPLSRDRSTMIVALETREQAAGVVTLVSHTRTYGPRDLRFAEDIARRAAMAIDNARLYRQAERAIRARDNVLAAVAHDLRGPLNTILMRTSSMLDVPAQAERRTQSRRATEALQRSARRMERLISDLVDGVSIEAGKFSIRKGFHTADEILHEALETVQPLATSKALELDVSIARCGRIVCDKGRIGQAMINLLNNAVHFTPKGKRIVVRCAAIDGELLVSVADEGPGIKPDQIRHVFDRFWQAEKMAGGGMGLGLWIAKGIIEAHGGRIWVESTPGRGTTFSFSIPLREKGSASRVVMIVEDDDDSREALAAVVERLGFETALARNGAEALHTLDSKISPCLILLDMDMPVMDGWAFLEERDKRAALRCIPVVIVTGNPVNMPEPVMAKPISADKLAEALRTIPPVKSAS
jgi:PAS domain S-box-containing protein